MKSNYLLNEIRQIKSQHPTTLISLVGGGGKTTTLLKLSQELKKEATVLVTTTTAMSHPRDGVDIIHYKTLPKHVFKSNKINALYESYSSNNDKMKGISPKILDEIVVDGLFEYILNEADGSKRKPLKCYATHEPVIPNNSHIVIVVLGADALGKSLSADTVHRVERFRDISQINIGDIITSDALVNVITSSEGFLKDLPENALAYVLINKSLSFPVSFKKNEFVESIFKKTNRYKAVIFSEMMDFKIESVFEYRKNSDKSQD